MHKGWKFKDVFLRLLVTALSIGALGSCAKSSSSDLVIRFLPKESLVVESGAYSCQQRLQQDLRPIDGTIIPPAINGPVVQFNRISLEWKKTTKLSVISMQIRFRGAGISGGESRCDLTLEMPFLFESTGAGNSTIYSGGTFLAPGKIQSNPVCRIACNIPLENPDVPEISATGEVLVRATEVMDEGTDNEKVYRVRSRLIVRVRP